MSEKVKRYRCRNRGQCDLAKNRQTIEIGGKTKFVCPLGEPNCEREHLQEIDPPQSGLPMPVVLGVGGLVAILIIGGALWFLFLGGSPSTGPEAVQQALTDVWPWLKDAAK